jgi:hypothetical protein
MNHLKNTEKVDSIFHRIYGCMWEKIIALGKDNERLEVIN